MALPASPFSLVLAFSSVQHVTEDHMSKPHSNYTPTTDLTNDDELLTSMGIESLSQSGEVRPDQFMKKYPQARRFGRAKLLNKRHRRKRPRPRLGLSKLSPRPLGLDHLRGFIT